MIVNLQTKKMKFMYRYENLYNIATSSYKARKGVKCVNNFIGKRKHFQWEEREAHRERQRAGRR